MNMLVKLFSKLKNVFFLYRLIGFGFAFYFVFGKATPDIRYSKLRNKPVEMSFQQLINTPKEDIPRYIRITDAVAGTSYVSSRTKRSDKLNSIYYPVYPNWELNNLEGLNLNSKSDSVIVSADSLGNISYSINPKYLYASLIILDDQVDDESLNFTYFTNSSLTIEGQYQKHSLDDEIMYLFTKQGLKISSEAIILHKNIKILNISVAYLILVLGLTLMALIIFSFLPLKFLQFLKLS